MVYTIIRLLEPIWTHNLELHSRDASSVGVMLLFQLSQHRKQFLRKVDIKITNILTIDIFQLLNNGQSH